MPRLRLTGSSLELQYLASNRDPALAGYSEVCIPWRQPMSLWPVGRNAMGRQYGRVMFSYPGTANDLRLSTRPVRSHHFAALALFLIFALLALIGCGDSAALGQQVVDPNPVNNPTSETTAETPAHKVQLSWNAAPAPVQGYNLYRGTKSGGPYTRMNAKLVPSTHFTDSSVKAGLTYYYVATSLDKKSVESKYSNQVKVEVPTP